jgi:hypothetical protein
MSQFESAFIVPSYSPAICRIFSSFNHRSPRRPARAALRTACCWRISRAAWSLISDDGFLVFTDLPSVEVDPIGAVVVGGPASGPSKGLTHDCADLLFAAAAVVTARVPPALAAGVSYENTHEVVDHLYPLSIRK